MKLFKHHDTRGRHARAPSRSRPAALLLLSVLATLSFTGNAGANTVVNGNIGSPTSIDAGVARPGFAANDNASPQKGIQ